MSNPTTTMNPEDMLTRIFLHPDNLTLTPEQVDWAKALARQTSGQQWQTYLTALALLGIEAWFQERAPRLDFSSDWLPQTDLSAAPRPSETAVLPDAIGRIRVGQYQLQLLTLTIPADEAVISRSTVDQPDQRPHFYLLVEILEELAQIRVYGFLQPERLAGQSLPLEEDAYLVPLDWFESNSSHLLLYLQHLEPAALTAPLPTAHSPHSPILPLAQRAINARLWLSNQLDQLAEDLTWVLLPPTPNLAMRSLRSPSNQLESVMQDLIERGEVELPVQLGNACRDIPFDEATVRLYAVTWSLPETDASPEWVLLVILGTPTGTNLPASIQLQVRDQTQLLADATPADPQDSYLYAQVRGEQDEQFDITVSLNSIHVTLPITFSSESPL